MRSMRDSVKQALDRVFHDRQIVVRSDIGASQFCFRRSHQLAVAGLFVGLASWGLAGTLAFTVANIHIDDQKSQIADLEVGYAALLADLGFDQNDLARQRLTNTDTSPFSEIRNGDLRRQVSEIQSAVAAALDARDEMVGETEALKAATELLNNRLQAAAIDRLRAEHRIEALSADLAAAEAREVALVTERQSLQGRIVDMAEARAVVDRVNQDLRQDIDELAMTLRGAYRTVDEAERRRNSALAELASVEASLAAARTEVAQRNALLNATVRNAAVVAAQRNWLTDERGALLGQLAGLEMELEMLREGQEQLFATMRERAGDHVERVEEGLAFTGLDIDALIDDLQTDLLPGRGGPLIPDLPPVAHHDPAWSEVVDVVSLADRAADLREVAVRLPLSRPLSDNYRLASRFGSRTDPFTGRRARHEGQDFAASAGTPIYATAPGVVVRAGVRGAYGNYVEIDHGLGVSSAYAHMNEIIVAVGEEVQTGSRIGAVGSTGRSTGPHLHYEVRVNGVAANPANFIKAGQHVLKIAE